MTSNRIFAIRLNLDDMAAGLDVLDGDKERSAWLRGFQAGCRGGAGRWPEGSPTAIGHALGAACHAEALALQAMQADKGRRSAEVRALNRCSTAVQPESEQEDNRGSNRKATGRQPIQISSNPEIKKTENRTPPPSSGVSPRGDYDATAATTTTHPAQAPDPEKIPTGVFLRIQAARPADVHDAIMRGDLLALVDAMGANVSRGGQWRTACSALNVATVAAIFDWCARDLKDPLREPSGVRNVRARWQALGKQERTRLAMATLRRYGIPTPEEANQEASA